MNIKTLSLRRRIGTINSISSYRVPCLAKREFYLTSNCLRPNSIAHVKQEPLFPGSYRFVTKFDGEYSYSYPVHTLAMIYDNKSMLVLSFGFLISPVLVYYLKLITLTWPIISGYGVLLYLISRWCASGRRNVIKRDLRNREVVITGATRGIGKATAMQLIQMGANVTVISRNGPHIAQVMKELEAHKVQKRITWWNKVIKHILGVSRTSNMEKANTKEVKKGNKEKEEEKEEEWEQYIKFEPLDLSNYIAIKEYVKRMRQSGKSIDLLINCAAMVSYTPITTSLNDDCQLAVNFLGPFLLTEGLLPLITTTHGRIVYVSCATNLTIKSNVVTSYLTGNGIWAMQLRSRFNGIEQYEFTKLANIYHAQDLAIRAYPKHKKFTKTTRVMLAMDKSNNVQHKNTPDANSELNSQINSHAAEPLYTVCACNPGMCISTIYHSLPFGNLFDRFKYVCLMFMRTPWEASQTVVNCCVREELTNGGFYANVAYQPSRLPKLACEVREREQVMNWTRNKMKTYMKWDK